MAIPSSPLNPEQLKRYSRQILFRKIGCDGQERICGSKAVVIGCGGLGSVASELLVRAGVGSVRIADRDCVELSNLPRQVLFDEEDALSGLPKAEAAEAKLRRINSSVYTETRVVDINAGNIEALIEGADVVVDALDNFETRYLLNDACAKHGIPWIYGAAVESQGTVMTILPGETPCLRCIFEEAPPVGSTPTCNMVGVISPIVHVIASLQVAEALKVLSGNEHMVSKHLRYIDVWGEANKDVPLEAYRGAMATCPICAGRHYEYLEARGSSPVSLATSLCGQDAMQVAPGELEEGFEIEALAERLKLLPGEVQMTRFMLKYISSEAQFTVFPDGRAIFQGVSDPAAARGLYAKFIGS